MTTENAQIIREAVASAVHNLADMIAAGEMPAARLFDQATLRHHVAYAIDANSHRLTCAYAEAFAYATQQ